MARATPAISTFSAGEVTPQLEGRTDHAVYFKSCRSLQNMIPLPWGDATRRPGTKYVASVKNAANYTHLRKFVFGGDPYQAYALEFGGQYVRFYKDEGQITVANTDAAIANGTFTGSLTSWDDRDAGAGVSAHDATNNRLSLTPGGVTAADIAWREQAVTTTSTNVAHTLRFRVIGLPGDFIQCRIGSASLGSEYVVDRKCGVGWHLVTFTPTVSPFYVQFRNQGSLNNEFTSLNKNIQVDDVSLLDNEALELTTEYAQADLADSSNRFKIRTAQSLDVMYLFHPDYPVYKLSRLGHSDWSLTEVAWQSGPLFDENTTATTLTPGAATGAAQTLTASSVQGINGDQGWQTTDVGRIVRVKEGTVYGWGVIVGWTSTTVVTVDIRSTFTNVSAKTTWALGLWWDRDGYPTAGKFSKQRLFAGGAGAHPQRIDGTEVGDFEDYTPGTGDSNPVSFAIDSDQANAIQWFSPTRVMLVGTAGSEERISADTDRAAITPANINVEQQSNYGSANMDALVAGESVIHLQRQGMTLRELTFSIESDGFKSVDLSLLAEHLTATSGIICMDFQARPWSVVWAARADGVLLSFTFQRDEQIFGWSRHVLGGAFGSGAPVTESLTVLGTSGNDQLWMINKRTVDGATVRYVEFMEEPFNSADTFTSGWYVDSGLAYSGAAVTTITGLSHLEGQSVQVLSANGVETKTVASGQITGLSAAVTAATVGLGSTWKLVPQRLEGGSPLGTAQGKSQRIHRVTTRTLRTAGLQYSADDSTYYGGSGTDDVIGITSASLTTGDTTVDVEFFPFPGQFDKDADIYLRGSQPLPATVISILPAFTVQDP